MTTDNIPRVARFRIFQRPRNAERRSRKLISSRPSEFPTACVVPENKRQQRSHHINQVQQAHPTAVTDCFVSSWNSHQRTSGGRISVRGRSHMSATRSNGSTT